MAVSSIDDRRLVESHKAGDEAAFAQIVEAYYQELLAHARRRLRAPQAAEDAVQESLLRAYRALGRFNGEYRLGAWLHRIVENVCADEGNRRRREAELVERVAALPLATGSEPHEAATARMPDPGFVRALASLSPTYREALLLRYVQGLPYKEVAQATGVTEENARARVHRARAALRRILAAGPLAVGWFVSLGRKSERALAEQAGSRLGSVSSHVALVGSTGPAKMAAAGRMAAVLSAVALPVASAGLSVTVGWIAGATDSRGQEQRSQEARRAVTDPAEPSVVAAAVALPAVSAATTAAPAVGPSSRPGLTIDGDTRRWEWFDPDNTSGTGTGTPGAPAEDSTVEISGYDLPVTVRGSTTRVEGAGVFQLPDRLAHGRLDAVLELPDESHADRPVHIVLRFIEDGGRSQPVTATFDGALVSRTTADDGRARYGFEGTYRIAATATDVERTGRFAASFVIGDLGSLEVDLLPRS